MGEIGAMWKHFGVGGKVVLALLAAMAICQIGVARAQTAGDLNGAIELVDPNVFRVCADPHHLPYSNTAGQGFENKIAALFAKKLGRPLAYTFYPDSQGFVHNTLNDLRCDVIIGIAQGVTMVQTTNPYYRTSFVLITKKGSGLGSVTSLADPKLKGKRLGVIAGTAPATYLAINGLMGKAKSYHLFIDTRYSSPATKMMDDLKKGAIDGAILWGPMGGYLAKTSHMALNVVPLVKDTSGPSLVYRVCMGVRHIDQHWKRTLNKLIAQNQPQINAILRSYGVPLLDEHDKPLTQ